MGIHYFQAYQQVVSHSYFILYPLFILLPRYMQQLPFSPLSTWRDNNSVAAIVIVCLFYWVEHRCCRRSRIQYSGAVLLPLLSVPWWETDIEPVFRYDRFCLTEGGTPSLVYNTPLLSILPHLPPISYFSLVDTCTMLCPASLSCDRHPLVNSNTKSRGEINAKSDAFPSLGPLAADIEPVLQPRKGLLCRRRVSRSPPPSHGASLRPDSVRNPPPHRPLISGVISIHPPPSQPHWPWPPLIVTVS